VRSWRAHRQAMIKSLRRRLPWRRDDGARSHLQI